MSVLQFFWSFVSSSANWHGTDGVPNRLLEHLRYSGLALLFSLVVAVPLGVALGHARRGGTAVTSAANAARALPTLGVLTLIVIWRGIGLTPVLVALVALALPAVLLNTYEGVRAVDAGVRDAARGMGLTEWQVVRSVELPLALPLILLGLRTAAIQIVSTATIAAYVGLGGLGRFIFDGLARRDYETVVGGAGLVALLAVVVEVGFVAAARWSSRRYAAA
jgi:osmoprotectant transport system permease protein